MQLVLYTIDLSGSGSSITVGAGARTLALDGVSQSVAQTALSSATPTAAATSLAADINTAALTLNSKAIKASSSGSTLMVLAVENDGTTGPITLNVPGTNLGTDTNWAKDVIQASYVDPAASLITPAAAQSQAVAMAAAAAALTLLVR